MKKVIVFIVLGIVTFNTFVYAEGEYKNDLRATILGDYDSGDILYSQDADKVVEIASITKLMTYLVTMDKVSQGEIALDDIVTVSQKAADVGGSSFRLRKGEKLKLATLLESTLIVSGNDSCVAIAEHIAGSEDEFVKMMNEKAKQIGLESAIFLNPNGLPEEEGQNRMTAKDIFELSRYVIKTYPQILETTKKTELYNKSRNFRKNNTNPILGKIENADGLKTGYTGKAGYCLVSTILVPQTDENQNPFRFIGIVMGARSSKERGTESIKLLKYGMDNFTKVKILSKEEIISQIEVDKAIDKEVQVFPKKDLCLTVRKGADIRKKFLIYDDIKAPLKIGAVVGNIIISVDGEDVEKMDLVIRRNVESSNIIKMFFRHIMN